ncbi:hypothetical protein Glove_109g68 [Diversispora epigaea]|uniref:Uncharacterized protein n=1 Tax=Diversispora epigaea TaxID=1348612 RepID=A0A397JB04_9GLOM|nr:hypothetical protein Glove_109g68 [Diversispora epigaea]
MKILFNTLENNNITGVDLKLPFRTLTNCIFKLLTIIADMPEASTYCLTYKSYNCKYPCFRCLTPLDKFNCINSVGNYEVRTNQTMKNLYENNRSQEFLLIFLYNIFWDYSDNIYKACVTDRMHQLDLELFKRMITCLKIFNKGIFRLSNVTAAEYRDMIKIMLFVFYKLENNNNDLSNVYAKFTKMYIMSRSNSFTTSDLELFKEISQQWALEFLRLFFQYSVSNLQLPKLHVWLTYTEEVIKEFGSLNGYSTDTYETLHKFYVKNPYNRTNKRNALKQISIMSDFMLDFNNEAIEKKISILRKCWKHFAHEEKLLFKSATIYKSAKLKKLNYNLIIRADEDFYGKSYYSDTEITMTIEQSGNYLTEDGMYYGKCILLLEIMFIRDDKIEKIEMGIFQWYDYAANVSKVLSNQNEIEDERHVLGCPYLKLLNSYDLVSLENINRIVHIIPDFSRGWYYDAGR